MGKLSQETPPPREGEPMGVTCIQGHNCTRMKNFGEHFLKKFAVDFDEILYVATACWFVGAHAKVIFKERTLLM